MSDCGKLNRSAISPPLLAAIVIVVLFESVRVWIGIWRGRIAATTTEVSFSHTREFLVDATAG